MPPSSQNEVPSAPVPPLPTKESWFGKLKGKPTLIIGIVVVLLAGYYFVYHSNTYLKAFSHKIDGGTGDGFYEVSYPTHKKFYYFRHWQGGEWPFQTYKMQTTFVDGTDADSFTVLGQYYAKDKNNAYFAFGQSRRVAAIPIVENESTRLLGEYYLAVGDKVYFEATELPGAHASDFAFLDPPTVPYGQNIGGERTFDARYTRSGSTVYYGGMPAVARRDGAFIKSITHTTIPCNPTEKQYSQGNTICQITSDGKDQSVGVDAATFSVLEPASPLHAYAKDKNHIYFAERYDCSEICGTLFVVEGADIATFTAQGRDTSYSFDKGCRIFSTEVDQGVRRMGGVGYGWCDYY